MTHSDGSATQRAYDFIRNQLKTRQVPPGTRLVTRNLARELGTSLNPIREALNRLASQGLVEHVPGSGTFVHRPDAKGIHDLYGVREAIESYAVGEAIDHISDEALGTLRGLCKGWGMLAEEMRRDGRQELDDHQRDIWAAQEELFHQTLVDASGNKMLSRIVSEQRVLATMFASLNEIDERVTIDTVEQVAATHSRLAESIASGDKDRAREQILALLRFGREQVLGATDAKR